MNIEKKPDPICLVGNPVVFRLSGDAEQVTLRITINDETTVYLLLKPAYTAGSSGYIDKDAVSFFEADISDILLAYAKPLSIELSRVGNRRAFVFRGGVRFKVAYNTSEASNTFQYTSINIDNEANEWFGLAGGFPDEMLAEGGSLINTVTADPSCSPFLLARGFSNGALHFYRSEMDATTLVMVKQEDLETDIQPRPLIKQASSDFLQGISMPSYNDQLVIRQYDPAGGTEYYYYIFVEDDPESDELHLLRFVNSFGCYEALLCTGEMQDISETEDPAFYNKVQNYAFVRRHPRRQQTRKYTLHTGHLTPERYQVLLDMLCSDEVAILQDGKYVPCAVSAGISLAATRREAESVELTVEILAQSKYNNFLQSGGSAIEKLGYLQAESGLLITDKDNNRIEITV